MLPYPRCPATLASLAVTILVVGCTASNPTRPNTTSGPPVKAGSTPGSVTQPTYIGKHDLYGLLVETHGRYVIARLRGDTPPKDRPWFRLNDLKPMFDTSSEQNCYMGIGILGPGAKDNKDECKSLNKTLFRVERAGVLNRAMQGAVLAITYGTSGTGRITNVVFDRDAYTQAVREATSANGADRGEIVEAYEALWAQWERETREYEAYGRESISLRFKVTDRSGLYREGDLTPGARVLVGNNKLTPPSSLIDSDVHSERPLSVIGRLDQQLRALWRNESSHFPFICQEGIVKGYNVDLKCPDRIPRTQGKQTIDIPVIVKSKDFRQVLPAAFYAKNEDMAAEIKGNDIVFYNNTDSFLTIEAVSIYYGGKIHTQSGLASELAPQSNTGPNPIRLSDFLRRLPSAERRNMTAAALKAKNVEFGIAVKYSKDSNNNKRTLFKSVSFNEYELIKG